MSTDYTKNSVSLNRNVTQADILKQLYCCIPDKLAYENVYFFPDRPWIRIKNHLYVYYFANEKIVLCERKRNAGKEYDVLLLPYMKQQNNKTLKSKSGVVKQGRRVLFVFGAALTLMVAYKGYKGLTLPDSAISTSIDNLDEESTRVLEEPEILVIPETLPFKEETFEEKILESESAVLPTIVPLQLYVSPTNSEGFNKRARTVEQFGTSIQYYATRYGMSCDFLIDQFSQERHNDFDNVSDEKKANIGQITSSIVCEPIIAPVFQDEVLIGEEGYFILPSTYPDSAPQDCLESLDTSYFTDIQKDNWKIALQKSESIPFTIYKKDEICTNVSKNIQVSVAYMSYLVNKKSDLIKGAMFYHAGVGDYSYEEILNRNVKKASDASYIYNILQYAPFQDGVMEYTILLKSGEKITYQIHNMLEVEKDYEEKIGYHL